MMQELITLQRVEGSLGRDKSRGVAKPKCQSSQTETSVGSKKKDHKEWSN
jgi:hypothetical protein